MANIVFNYYMRVYIWLLFLIKNNKADIKTNIMVGAVVDAINAAGLRKGLV